MYIIIAVGVDELLVSIIHQVQIQWSSGPID